MKKISLIAIVIFLIFISVSWVSAQTTPEYSPLVKIPGINPGANLTQYLSGLFNFVIAVVGILAMAMIIYGGMRYLTSVGNPTIAEDGKDAILSAIYGLILALSAWVIIYVVNPDILILKKPGVKVSENPFIFGNKNNLCIKGPGSGTNESKCKCVDGAEIVSTNPNINNCNQICSTPSLAGGGYHCIKADIQIEQGNYQKCGYHVTGKKISSLKACDSLAWDPTGSVSLNPIISYEVYINGHDQRCTRVTTTPECGAIQLGASIQSSIASYIACGISPGENKITLRITDNATPPHISEDTALFTVSGPPSLFCW